VFCFYICFFREPALHEMLILIKRCCAAEKRSWKIKSGIKAMGKMAKKNKEKNKIRERNYRKHGANRAIDR